MDTSTTPRSTEAAWRCTWHAGPDAGSVQHLAPGSHLLGRAASAALRADDRALQPHHALVDVCPDGSLTITQLTGGHPLRVNGTAADGRVQLADGAWVEVGNSLLSFTCRPADEHAARLAAAHLHDGAVVRGPRAIPRWEPVALAEPGAPPPEDERTGGLVPAIAGVAGSALLAIVMHQPTFVLFGALGALVALASWAAQHVARRRRRRRAARDHAAAVVAARAANDRARAAFRAHHSAAVPTLVDAVAVALDHDERLWQRRGAHGDATVAALGLGDVGWPQPVDLPPAREALDAPVIAGVAVPVDLAAGCRLAVRGPQAPAVARALLVQLATSCGPADVRIVVVTDRPADWAWLGRLPHLALPDGSCAIVDDTALTTVLHEWEATRAHLVLVTDAPAMLATRTSPLRRLLADAHAHALLAVLPAGATVPQLCTAALTTTDGPTARWVADTRDTLLPVDVRLAALGARAAGRVVDALAGLIDPEDPLSTAAGMPRSLSLVDLHGGRLPDAAAIAQGWAGAGHDPAPRALVGAASDGVVDIDLVRDGPHGLLAGTTGAGKSELLRTLVVGMALHTGPTHLTFVLVDYKGGATFDACADLPHVVGVITDLDDHLADRALRSLHAELRRREAVLREHGAADLPALRAVAPTVVLPRLVVVIDEFAALVAEQPAFLHALVGIAQRGRSLGVHLVLATQRPQGVISDDIRANTNLRLALRLHDPADGMDVVGSAAPAQLPRRVPGRAVLRLGVDEHLTFQAARCTTHTDGGPSPLEVLVRAIGDAARMVDAPRPPAPWQPPLPTRLTADGASGALGLVDDPDHQRILQLHRGPDDGHLLLAGSAGSGVSATLCTLAAHTLRTTTDHVYVVDARGSDAFAALAAHPRCGGVVRAHDRELIARLLHRLHDRSRSATTCSVRAVLVIDGLDALRRTLDDAATTEEYDALADLLATADAADVTIIAGVEHTAAVPAAFAARCPQRWVLHLHDPHDAAVLGVPAACVPPAVPGRVVLAPECRTAQLTEPSGASGAASAGHAGVAAVRLEPVPATVRGDTLAPGWRHEGTSALSLGLDVSTGGTHLLRVHDGEHVLVLGGARTGRSTALARLAAAWQELHPEGAIGAITPRGGGGPLAALPAADLDLLATWATPGSAGPVLLVVDDAEAVDDPDGRLAALAAGGRACVIAAGRPDALRQAYGHWTGVVRRSRLGLVASGGGELDGDLVGTLLPRRTVIAPRAGLMWVVDGGSVGLVQVATGEPACSGTRLGPR